MTSNIVLQGMSAGQTLVTQGYGGTYTAPPAPTAAPTGTTRTLTWPPTRTKEELLKPEKPKLEVFPQPLPVGMTFEELVAYAHEMLAVKHVTAEDLERVLRPLIPRQQASADPYGKLRELLVGFKRDDELFIDGLREILRNMKQEEKN